MEQGKITSTASPAPFSLIKFPKISDKPNNLFKALGYEPEGRRIDKVQMTGTVKLHGSHAEVVIHPDGRIQLQSMNTANLTVEKDNYGFAAFMLPLRAEILALKDKILDTFQKGNPKARIDPESPLIIAGEWVGPGITKGTAMSLLEKKSFVIFSISINGKWVLDEDYYDISNEKVRIYSIMRCGKVVQIIDLKNKDAKAAAIAAMQSKAKGVYAECPFAKSLGLKGPGEGIVWKATKSLARTLRQDEQPLHASTRLWLKMVGSGFAESTTGQLANPGNTVDMRAHAKRFAEACVTRPRLEKRLETLKEKVRMEKGRLPTRADVARFINLVMQDVLEEESGEVRARGMELGQNRKLLENAVEEIAGAWFFKNGGS